MRGIELKSESSKSIWQNCFPTRALALLLTIGFVDLVLTAVLHKQGLIVELNPLMRPLIERSEWLFVLVKASTLILAWVVMYHYSRTHLEFVRKAATIASVAYLLIWTTWFIAGSMMLG
ncbi:DUF5658 family protein [Kamptonema cortianum]|nr:DUF5658 family protein [Kamptonema cortianum]